MLVDINDLPPELLASIFTEAYHQETRRCSISFCLAHVSQKWRIVALENAVLWARIDIVFKVPGRDSDFQLNLVNYLLHLSRQHPLAIHIDCRDPPDYDMPMRTIAKIGACIKPHAYRWESFVATFSSTKIAKIVLSSLFINITSLNQLRYLRLNTTSEPTSALVPFGFQPLVVDFPEPLRGDLLSEPSLKTLRCINFDPLHCVGDVTGLRQLDIYVSEPDIVLDYQTFRDTLKAMVNVERLSIVGVTFRMPYGNPDLDTITLNSVTSFSYSIVRDKPGMVQSWVPLCAIDTPYLRELNLGASFDVVTQDDPLGSTVQSYLLSPSRTPLFPHLQKLRISGPIIMEDIIPFHYLFPGLETLIVGIGADGTRCVEEIRANAVSTAKLTQQETKLHCGIWPRLQTLALYECDIGELLSLAKQRSTMDAPLVEVLVGPVEISDEMFTQELKQLVRVTAFPQLDPLYTPHIERQWSLEELGVTHPNP